MAVEDTIMAQIADLSKMLTTKAEIVEYYQSRFPGRGADSWKQHLVQDLAANTGMKAKNLERRFDPSRLNNVPRTKREKEQYVELGEQIGPIPPENGLLVSFHGEIRISKDCFYREFDDLFLDAEEAQELAETGDIHIVLTEYFQGQDIAEDLCGEPQITITAAAKNQQQMVFQHEMHGPSAYASILKR